MTQNTKSTAKKTRKPRAASFRDPPDWLYDALGGRKATSGVRVNESTALTVAAVFACVRSIAEDVAKIPLTLKRIDGDRKVDAVEHPLFSVLRFNPNPNMTSLTFRRSLTIMALLWGNGYAEIQRTGSGQVVALHPIHPSRVTPKMNGGLLEFEVIEPDNTRVTVPQADMLHLCGIGEGVVGYSLVKLGKEAIGLAIAAEQFAGSFFGRGTRLSGILKHPGKLSPEAAKNLKASWEKAYGGPDNANGTAVLEEGMEWMRDSAPPEEAQMLETRIMSVQEACRLFRVPPHKVFELSRGTFSNIEHQSLEYVGDALYTWFVAWDQEIKRKLIRPSEKNLFTEHAFQNLIQGDMAARSTRQRELFNIGAMSINDIRREIGLNPIAGPEGDVYWVNATMIPAGLAIEKVETDIEAAQAKATPEPAPTAAPSPPEPDAAARIARLERAIPAHENLLAEAFARVLRAESGFVTAAAKKPGFREWSEKFYAQQHEHVHEHIGPTIAAFASSMWLILTPEGMGEQHQAAILAETKVACARHVERSVAEMREPSKVSAWAEDRAAEQAATEIKNLSKLITTLAGITQ